MSHSSRELFDQYFMQTYAPGLVITEGKGSQIFDEDGNEYLDFTTGISVCNLGHCYEPAVRAVQEQAGKLWHVSNLFINEVAPKLAAEIIKLCFDGRVFFANSGAEANEGLIKFARRWGHNNGGRNEIIVMNESFHGRTLAALAATGRSQYREGFAPDMPGFTHVPYNDLDAVKAAMTDKTAAVLLEAVQGEGGVMPADKEYLEGLRQFCDEQGILLLFDEVQTGWGRTGEVFAYQAYGVEPDGFSMAKALGNGMPIGGFVVQRKHEKVLQPGMHATTFGGTPLASSAALAVVETFTNTDIIAQAKANGKYFFNAINSWKEELSCIKEVRGLGMMIGIRVSINPGEVVKRCRERGLLILTAGADVLRLLPALNIEEKFIDKGLSILKAVIKEVSNEA